MINEEHLSVLKQGAKIWNEWRLENRDVRPRLFGARLEGRDLSGVDLKGADLR
ncbi:MAG: pentapeptide repeat-containing protein, partial [Chloroflexota bacterium]|nr:pentapeptide repeat-containing protein [Chloroflexota bacterium]